MQHDEKQDKFIEKDEIKINGSNIVPNLLRACKNNKISINIKDEDFLDSEMVKFMPKWLLYQLSEKNLNFNNLINRKRKITTEEGNEIDDKNYKKPIDIEYLMEYYQIQIPIFFNNKAFKEKIKQILDEKELNRINVKKNKKTIIKNTYHNYL